MPQKKLRYSQYLAAIGRHHRRISYNEVVIMERAMPAGAARLRLVDVHLW